MSTPAHDTTVPVTWLPTRPATDVPNFDALPPADAEQARVRLAQLEHACGCQLGAAAALLGTSAYVALVAWTGTPDVPLEWRIAIGAVIFVVTSALGKTVGIARARKQRERFIRQLNAAGSS